MPNLEDDIRAVLQKQQEVEQMNEHIKMRKYISYLMHENKKLKKLLRKLKIVLAKQLAMSWIMLKNLVN